MKKLIILAASAAAFASPALAAPGDTSTAQGSATAEVVAPITLEHVAEATLNFGTFTTGDAGGSVIVDQSGVGTASGEVTLLSDSVEAADAFTVEGDPNRNFTISTTSGSVSNGTDTMTFTTSANTAGALGAGGSAAFSVGGTLTVPGGAPAGVYTGTYSVTVAYE